MTRSRCTYCRKKCPDDYCCNECRSKGEAYFARLDSLGHLSDPLTKKLLIGLFIYITIVVLICMRSHEYIGLALLPFGIFLLFWPYVNNDTMKFMSIRSGKLVLKIIGVIWIAGCIIGSVATLT